MAEEIALALGMVAAVYGVAELMIHVSFWLLFGGKQEDGCLILCAPVDEQGIEYAARKLSAVHRFIPIRSKAIVLVKDSNIQWIQTLCRELELDCCSKEEFAEMLFGGLQEGKNAV